MSIKVQELFKVTSGDFHALKELEPGLVPLVSCGDTDNGVIGYYDIPGNKCYSKTITVAYNGSWPIMSKFHPCTFGAKDDVAVLTPLQPMHVVTLLYTAALFNGMTWRYSYGRKCFRDKLKDVDLPVPVVRSDAGVVADEEAIRRLCPNGVDGIGHSILGQTEGWLAAIAGIARQKARAKR